MPESEDVEGRFIAQGWDVKKINGHCYDDIEKVLDEVKSANTIRFLAADMVQKANSGHPGAPMGLADIAVVLSEKLSHNPKNLMVFAIFLRILFCSVITAIGLSFIMSVQVFCYEGF